MWTPKNIEEFLDERIKFCGTFINSNPMAQAHNPALVNEKLSDFTKALVDYEYCKKLYNQFKQNPNDTKTEDKFKKLAIHLLLAIWDDIDNNQKGYLTQESKDDFKELKEAIENIFQDLNIKIKHLKL